MAQVVLMQASYQTVRTNIPKKELGLNEIELVNNFQAPPGFRLHSWQVLRDSQLVGMPHQLVMIFETLSQQVVEVPDQDDLPDVSMLTDPPAGNA